MRTLRYSFVIAAVLGGTVLATAAPASAATIDVRPGQSIQAAIDGASPGDTIVVHPGTYHEAVQITKDGITLQGSGASGSGTVLVPPASSSSFCTEANGSPSGVCVVGKADPSTGAVLRPVKDVHVTGFYIHDFPANGVFGYGTSNLQIDHIDAAHNDEYGIARFVSSL